MTRLQKSLLLFLVALVLFTVVRLWFYLQHLGAYEGHGFIEIATAFVKGLRFDGAMVARFFAIPLLLMALPWRFLDKRWWSDTWGWFLFIVTLGMVLVLIGDLLYFDEVKRHVSYELTLLRNDFWFLVSFALRVYWFYLLLFLLFAVALGYLWHKILAVPLRPARWSGVQFAAVFFALLVVGRGGFGGKVVEIIDAYDTGNSEMGHLVLNGLFSTVVFSLNMDNVNHHFYEQQEAKEILRTHRGISDEAYPMTVSFPENRPTRKNVVIVLMESWNFDYVDSFGGKGIGATPNFDALAKEGLRFTRFYAAGQRSIEGIQATVTGIPALQGLPRIDAGIGVSNFSRMGHIAVGNGYHTLFIQTSARDSFKVQGVAQAAGFQEYYGKEDIPLVMNYPDPSLAEFGWDYDMLMFLKGKLDRMQQPFLAYAFTGTTHTPYPDLEGHRLRLPHGYDDENGYINALHYSDWSIGEFMKAAQREPWFDDTIFIFTADHATHFQQGDLLQRFHIPLLIYSPGAIKAGINDRVASQLDIFPTVMDLLGFREPFSALGESLLKKREEYAFVTEGATNIGLISPRAYLTHNLKRRVETSALTAGVTGDEYDRMEHHLLALDQMAFELLRDNKWAR